MCRHRCMHDWLQLELSRYAKLSRRVDRGQARQRSVHANRRSRKEGFNRVSKQGLVRVKKLFHCLSLYTDVKFWKTLMCKVPGRVLFFFLRKSTAALKFVKKKKKEKKKVVAAQDYANLSHSLVYL